MLPAVLLAMFSGEVRSEKLAGVGRIGQEPRNRIEIVVAHHRERSPRVDHTARDHHGIDLLRSTINEVPYKDRAPIRMTPCPGLFYIAHLAE